MIKHNQDKLKFNELSLNWGLCINFLRKSCWRWNSGKRWLSFQFTTKKRWSHYSTRIKCRVWFYLWSDYRPLQKCKIHNKWFWERLSTTFRQWTRWWQKLEWVVWINWNDQQNHQQFGFNAIKDVKKLSIMCL